jgi:hypothetical protein
MRSASLHILALLLAVAALFAPARALAQRMGLFFDLQASDCDAPLEPFAPLPCLQVYVFAFPPPGVELGGVAFKIELPPQVEVCEPGVLFPHNQYFDVRGSLENGFDARFATCQSGTDPILVAQFGIADVTLTASTPRPDLVLHLSGAVVDSLRASTVPRLLVCDPGNPEGNQGLINAPSVDARLNCTHQCGCTTAIAPRSWSAVKSLYREP